MPRTTLLEAALLLMVVVVVFAVVGPPVQQIGRHLELTKEVHDLTTALDAARRQARETRQPVSVSVEGADPLVVVTTAAERQTSLSLPHTRLVKGDRELATFGPDGALQAERSTELTLEHRSLRRPVRVELGRWTTACVVSDDGACF